MSYWKRKRVFVTGGTGLLGGWLVKALLHEGAEVTALVRDYAPKSMFLAEKLWLDCNVVDGDVRDYGKVTAALHEYRSEVVFHLAAQTLVETALEYPADTFDVNVGGTTTVCEAVRQAKRWVEACVIASSDKAYGDHGGQSYVPTMKLLASLPYDASKAATEYVAASYAKTYGLPIAITRCGNFFGGGDLNFSRIVPGTIRSIYDGQAPVIRSDGQAVRDYIYVKDGALAYMWLAERVSEPKAKQLPWDFVSAWNFGYQDSKSVRELVDLITLRMGGLGYVGKLPVIEDRVQHLELDRQVLSAAESMTAGWKPGYTLESALAETCEWYVDHLKAQDRKKAHS